MPEVALETETNCESKHESDIAAPHIVDEDERDQVILLEPLEQERAPRGGLGLLPEELERPVPLAQPRQPLHLAHLRLNAAHHARQLVRAERRGAAAQNGLDLRRGVLPTGQSLG